MGFSLCRPNRLFQADGAPVADGELAGLPAERVAIECHTDEAAGAQGHPMRTKPAWLQTVQGKCGLGSLEAQAVAAGLRRLSPGLPDTVRCGPEIRYGERPPYVAVAISAHHAALALCADSGPQTAR